jgi:hypothetical protein
MNLVTARQPIAGSLEAAMRFESNACVHTEHLTEQMSAVRSA